MLKYLKILGGKIMKEGKKSIKSFEQRLLDLRFKNSKEKDYLFGEDEKRSSKKSKSQKKLKA